MGSIRGDGGRTPYCLSPSCDEVEGSCELWSRGSDACHVKSGSSNTATVRKKSCLTFLFFTTHGDDFERLHQRCRAQFATAAAMTIQNRQYPAQYSLRIPIALNSSASPSAQSSSFSMSSSIAACFSLLGCRSITNGFGCWIPPIMPSTSTSTSRP
jgi:hypothetical protein